MVPLYSVISLVKGRKNQVQLICADCSLFMILWILDHSDSVIVFTVTCELRNQKSEYFGWGPFSKWVESFTPDHWKQT